MEECGHGRDPLPNAAEREEDEDPVEQCSAEDRGQMRWWQHVNALWEKVSCKGYQQNGMPAARDHKTKEGLGFVLKTGITGCAVLMGIMIQGCWPCQHF